jgi:triosephosphate isomerase
MRRMLIAGNWKMNKSVDEAVGLLNEIKAKLPADQGVDVLVCPAFVCLESSKRALAGTSIKLGAQNMYWEDSGAFTGEISADMLVSVGAGYVIIGHSERRQVFGETNESVNLKLKQALAKGLAPIVCVGETLAERESGKTFEVLKTQLEGGLAEISPQQMKGVVLAYEPVWAIGTGKVATKEQAQETHAFIRDQLRAQFDSQTADAVVIQYGGSVKPDNAKELLGQPDVDGALIGGASLKADDFVAIVNEAG